MGFPPQSLSQQEGGLVYACVYPKLGLEVCSFHSFIHSFRCLLSVRAEWAPGAGLVTSLPPEDSGSEKGLK